MRWGLRVPDLGDCDERQGNRFERLAVIARTVGSAERRALRNFLSQGGAASIWTTSRA